MWFSYIRRLQEMDFSNRYYSGSELYYLRIILSISWKISYRTEKMRKIYKQLINHVKVNFNLSFDHLESVFYHSD